MPRVADASLLRFLELVQRELGAVDTRIEVGGRDPEESRVIFRMTPTGARVVAILAEPPPDRSKVEARLEALIASFFGLAEHSLDSIPPSRNVRRI